MEPRKKISERYGNGNNSPLLVEFPKVISRKRVFETAWMWFSGNGARRVPVFQDALRKSWEYEKDLIKSGGAIYHPYIIFE
jgi:hypothetical protein